MQRKAILLAGGAGTRLYPTTLGMSKQMLPIFDKPMIYYSLSVIMLAEIRDILVISTPRDLPIFQHLLGSGKKWGLNFSYLPQEHPGGIAQSLIIGTDFLGNFPSLLMLGDNIFYGDKLSRLLVNTGKKTDISTIFAYQVRDPERYGVVEFDKNNKVLSLEEKPANPKSNFAITGLYFYDNNAPYFAKLLKPSLRGELEITDLNKIYLQENNLSVQTLGRGFAWLDTGTHESLLEASQFIAAIEHRQGFKIGCPEEIAWRMKWIDDAEFEKLGQLMPHNQYGQYLLRILKEK